jgi:DNA repair exonuclease SbcCD nuclease subunit
MSLKILHTSDIHLGMKFAGYPEVQSELSQARFKSLEKLVNIANERKCDLFVLSGDIFDRVSIVKKDIIYASNILKDFQGRLVAVLPGNHDFISKGHTDLWSHFKENMADNVLLLAERKIYSLEHYDLDINLYACPCNSKHSTENAVGWIKEVEKDRQVTHHIGIAHGSLDGFSPDFDKKYYPMTVPELQKCGLDLWLVGHTHTQYPVNPGVADRIFFPGTPEPDGFDCQQEGKAWFIETDNDKKVHPVLLSTGTFRFLHDEVKVNNSKDIKHLEKRFSSDDYKQTLLKLKISGRIRKDDYKNLPKLRKILGSQLFHLILNEDGLTEEITLEAINQEFSEGSFPHKILNELAHDSESLQIAYDIMREIKK